MGRSQKRRAAAVAAMALTPRHPISDPQQAEGLGLRALIPLSETERSAPPSHEVHHPLIQSCIRASVGVRCLPPSWHCSRTFPVSKPRLGQFVSLERFGLAQGGTSRRSTRRQHQICGGWAGMDCTGHLQCIHARG